MSKGRSYEIFNREEGIEVAEVRNWTGKILVAERYKLKNFVSHDDLRGKTGVYLLLGNYDRVAQKQAVYIGESDDLSVRLTNHDKDQNKAFWQKVCVLTSKDDKVTKSHVLYLESRLINIANQNSGVDLKNTKKSEYWSLSESDKASMDSFLEYFLDILPRLKIYIFTSEQSIVYENKLEKQIEPKGNYPIYPEYHTSGIEWIGSIPKEWKVVPAFAAVNEQKNSNKGMVESKVLSLSYGKIVARNVESNMGLIPESFETYQVVDPGNIVLRLTDLQNDKKSLRVGLTKNKGIISSAYLCLNPKKIDSHFAYYLLHSYDLCKVFYFMGAGVRQSMSYSDIRRLPLVIPPFSEQQAIATFLDRETARIDGVIGKKERLIKLLEEKRQAVISHAVTKGINPDAPLKDSGIDWLGQIPAHWTAARVKHAITFITSGSRGWADYYSDEGSRFLQSGNIGRHMGLNWSNLQRVSPPQGAEGVRTIVGAGDVLVCITGGRTGSVAVVNNPIETTYINQHVALLRPNSKKSISRYLAYSLWSYVGQKQFSLYQYGLKEGLGLDNVLNTCLALPNLEEQVQIVSFLDVKLKHLDDLIEKTMSAINKLKEHRTSLISAAVTGKIDVRGLVDDGDAA